MQNELGANAVSSSPETTALILQTLVTLTSFPEGAMTFCNTEDISPVTEIATAHKEALQVLTFAWLNAMHQLQDHSLLRLRVDQTIQNLVVTFKGTDAVTFLEFVGYFLRHADPDVSESPFWLRDVLT
jgi:hypothetical protein